MVSWSDPYGPICSAPAAPAVESRVDYSCGFPDLRDNGKMRYGELRPAPETAAGFLLDQLMKDVRTMNTCEPCAQR
jgi:hypothetical protein